MPAGQSRARCLPTMHTGAAPTCTLTAWSGPSRACSEASRRTARPSSAHTARPSITPAPRRLSCRQDGGARGSGGGGQGLASLTTATLMQCGWLVWPRTRYRKDAGPAMHPAQPTLGNPWRATSCAVWLPYSAAGDPRKSRDTAATGRCTSQRYVPSGTSSYGTTRLMGSPTAASASYAPAQPAARPSDPLSVRMGSCICRADGVPPRTPGGGRRPGRLSAQRLVCRAMLLRCCGHPALPCLRLP